MIIVTPSTDQQTLKAILRTHTLVDDISIIVTEEGTQRAETLNSVNYQQMLYYTNLYPTFSILKEDNFYNVKVQQNNTTIYKDKMYCTSQDISQFNINNNAFVSNINNTEFITI